jgi:hypothetical protein
MPFRVGVSRCHVVTRLEFRDDPDIPVEGLESASCGKQFGREFRVLMARHLRVRMAPERLDPLVQLLLGDDSLIDQSFGDPFDPSAVVTGPEVNGRMKAFEHESE